MQKISTFITTTILIALIISASTILYANNQTAVANQTSSNPEPQVQLTAEDEVATSCPVTIEGLANIKVNEFYLQLEPQLESANFNSESLNFIFKAYRDTQNELSRIRKRQLDSISESARQFCITSLAEKSDQLRYVFIQTYIQITNRKRDFLLLEKYDSLNSQLEDLQEEMNSFESDIENFNDLLPCFATQCVTR
jgi:hypothetical protein